MKTVGEFLGHILGNVSLPGYYRKQPKMRWFVHVVLPIVSLATIVLGIFYTFFPISVPFIYPALFSIALLVAGAMQYLIVSRRRERREQVQYAFGTLGLEDDI